MEGGPPMFNPGSTSPSLIEGYDATSNYRAFTVFGRAFQRVRWAHIYPLSLAATHGVACCFPFLRVLRCFSSPGLPHAPMHSVRDTPKGGFPHSEIHRSQLGYQLPVAYRRFQRLSSPLDAKSSAVCPSWFDHTDHTPLRITPLQRVTDRQRPPSSAEGQDNRPDSSTPAIVSTRPAPFRRISRLLIRSQHDPTSVPPHTQPIARSAAQGPGRTMFCSSSFTCQRGAGTSGIDPSVPGSGLRSEARGC